MPLLWPHPRRFALPLLADGISGRVEALLSLALLAGVAALSGHHLATGT